MSTTLPIGLVEDQATHRHRWTILAVVCLSVFVTVVDGTIVNIALPTLTNELGASTRELQWIVDSYLLVFTGLLLAAGGLGDRWGRRGMLVAGLAVFGVTSGFAAWSDSTGELITWRALMGIGGAMIFPATLAIITNVFTDAKERAVAIGVWAAVTGVAVAAGPILGGWLLDDYWWGSVFLINVPVAAVAIVAVVAIVPESKESTSPRFDVVGLVLSVGAIGSLVFSIIEAPEWGWASGRTATGLLASVVVIAAFLAWELRVDHPMMPVRIFRNLRFSAASVAITSAFFALFGFVFLIAQYMQLIRGYGPLEAGVRTIPVALSIATASGLAPKIVELAGTKRVVVAGLALMSIGFMWVSTDTATTPYWAIAGQMVVLGAGLGLTAAPATESIMGSLPRDKAGVGSAVNDTTRELGGTLGVAILGSVFSSMYVRRLDRSDTVTELPTELQEATAESVGAAQAIAERLGDAGPAYLADVNDAFLSGLTVACWVSTGIALAGAVFAHRYLPACAPGDIEAAEADPDHPADRPDGAGRLTADMR